MDLKNLVERGYITELKSLKDLTPKSFGYDVDSYHGRNKYFALKSSYEWKKKAWFFLKMR